MRIRDQLPMLYQRERRESALLRERLASARDRERELLARVSTQASELRSLRVGLRNTRRGAETLRGKLQAEKARLQHAQRELAQRAKKI